MCQYLDHLNYKYDVRKKSYFVDGHEHKDVIDDQIRSCNHYTKSTLPCYDWVQISKEQLQPLLDKHVLSLEEAYVYTTENDVEMFENHINAMKELSAFVKLENKDICGSLFV